MILNFLIELYNYKIKCQDLVDNQKYGDASIIYGLIRKLQYELFNIIIDEKDERISLDCEFKSKGLSEHDMHREIIDKFIISEYNYVPKVTFAENKYKNLGKDFYRDIDGVSHKCVYKMMLFFLTEIRMSIRNDKIDYLLQTKKPTL